MWRSKFTWRSKFARVSNASTLYLSSNYFLQLGIRDKYPSLWSFYYNLLHLVLFSLAKMTIYTRRSFWFYSTTNKVSYPQMQNGQENAKFKDVDIGNEWFLKWINILTLWKCQYSNLTEYGFHISIYWIKRLYIQFMYYNKSDIQTLASIFVWKCQLNKITIHKNDNV